jgi:cold shock protein
VLLTGCVPIAPGTGQTVAQVYAQVLVPRGDLGDRVFTQVARMPTVPPMVDARVREWHDEAGWGVLDSIETPGGCWTHFSVIQMDEFRVLRAGQVVDLEWERPAFGYEGFDFFALRVVPKG